MNLRKQYLLRRLMAPVGEADTGGTDVIDQPDAAIEDAGEAEDGNGEGDAGAAGEDADEVVITIGDTAPPEDEEQHAPAWVREVRKTNRELARENKELKARLSSPAEEKSLQLSAEPSMQDEDIDYDEDKYKAKYRAWLETKRQIDAKNAKAQEDQAAQAQAWQSKLEGYGKGKVDLRVPDFDDAEGVAQEKLSVMQQGIVLQASKNSAMFVYAIGKNKEHAEKLASIKDPVEFAWEAGKLEGSMKQQTRAKSPPPPARLAQGSAKISGTNDSTLEALRREALKSGDHTKVLAYRNQKRA